MTDEEKWRYESLSTPIKNLKAIGAKIGPKNWQAWKTLVGEFSVERVASAAKALPASDRWPDKTEEALRAQGSQQSIGDRVKHKIIRIVQ